MELKDGRPRGGAGKGATSHKCLYVNPRPAGCITGINYTVRVKAVAVRSRYHFPITTEPPFEEHSCGLRGLLKDDDDTTTKSPNLDRSSPPELSPLRWRQ